MAEARTKPEEAPAVRVRLPTVLTILFPGAPPRVELRAATVAEAIDGLNERWPGMGDRIRDTRPAIRRHINIFVDGRKAGLETPLA
ncbi:thiamine biosynthesis protein ThiS, partial [Inquilinus limosus MP06]